MPPDTVVTRLLHGAVDLHCHSAPSPFPRRLNHVEAARDAERIGMRAIVVKSHHHSTVTDLQAMADPLRGINTGVYGGLALNSTVGGINPAAVAMCLRLGGRVVWFPTLSSPRHAASESQGLGFPTASVDIPMAEVDIVDADGELLPEVHQVLDIIKETGALVTGGHMAPDRIRLLFAAARARGITRMLVNHPNFIIDASVAQVRECVALGAHVEHELSMYDPEGGRRWDPRILLDWIEQIGPDRTVLASDLGQQNRPLPADSFVRMIGILLDLGLGEKDIRLMIQDNPAYLLNLP